MDKKKRTFWILIAALLVVGIVGIGISLGDVGRYGEATGGDGSKGVYGIATNTGDVRNYGGYFVANGSKGVGVYGRGSEGGYFTTTTAGGGTWDSFNQFAAVNVSTAYTWNPGVYAMTTGDYSTGFYAETTGDGSGGVYAYTTGDGSGGVSAMTTGDGSGGVSAMTTGDGSEGVYASTQGDDSYGVRAYTDGKNSDGVYVKTYGNDSDGVHALTRGRYSDGFYAHTSGVGARGFYARTIGDYSHGVRLSTSGDYSEGVDAQTTGDHSEGVYASTTGFGSEGVNAHTTGTLSHGVCVSTSGRHSHGVCVSTSRQHSHGVCVSTSGEYSDGARVSSKEAIGVRSKGESYDFYAAGIRIKYGPFTGAHDVKLSANFTENVTPGMIVSVTGETQVRQIDGRTISFSSTLPTVQLSGTPNDSKVLGVLISESPLPGEHWYINESIEGDRFGIVNALGEGRVWVTDVNGDFEAGDYITTSLVAGYGQKQDDDLLHSYTLGKAIESVNWSEVTTTVEFNGQTYRAYPIAVVYTSG